MFSCKIDICDFCQLRFETIADGKHKTIIDSYYKITLAKQGKTSDSEIKRTTNYKKDGFYEKFPNE